MKYLIIGLGNPGNEYQNTRHNIGFQVLDRLVSLSNTTFSVEKLADVATLKFKGRQLMLVKPNTFMNLSGKAVNYWLQKTKVSIDNILVVTDDISLPFGMLRLRKGGSDGGHNGLKDITNRVGSDFMRLRFGIGHPPIKNDTNAWVIKKPNPQEKKGLDEAFKKTLSSLDQLLDKNWLLAMNDLHSK